MNTTIPKKAKKIYDYHLAYLGIAMIVACFLGFVGENIFRLITKGIIDSRFMILPFIAPYGLALFAIYLVLGTPDKMRFFSKEIFRNDTFKDKILSYLTYGVIVMFTIMIGEIAVGTIYESISGLTIWDYSNVPLHITKFTSIITSFIATIAIVLIMRFLFIPFMNLLEQKMNYKTAKIISIVLGLLIVVDCIYMMINLLVFGKKIMYWTIKFY